VAVIALSVLVFVFAVGVLIHHIGSDRNRRRNRERFEGATLLLAPYLVSNDSRLHERVEEARRRFGDRAVGLVLRRARYDIRGAASDSISAILVSMGAVKELEKQARSRRDWMRAVAIRGLGECGGAEARAMMIEAARDEAGEVRRAAREGLLADGTPIAVKVAIDSFLEDLPRRAGWRRSFYAKLSTVSSPELIDLIRAQRLPVGEEKLALEALADSGAKNALPLAVEKLSSPEAELRSTAAKALGKLGNVSHLPLLLERLEDKEWFVRASAARGLELMSIGGALQTVGPDSQTDICRRLGARLTDSSWWVRSNAARALSHQGEYGASVLLDTAEGTDAYARDAALAALAMAPLGIVSRERLNRIIMHLVASEPGAKPRPAIAPAMRMGAVPA
jgi:HEAT repeat protein